MGGWGWIWAKNILPPPPLLFLVVSGAKSLFYYSKSTFGEILSHKCTIWLFYLVPGTRYLVLGTGVILVIILRQFGTGVILVIIVRQFGT